MKTIVPESIKAAAMAHPCFQEFESRMRAAYGTDWEPITHDEAARQEASKRDATMEESQKAIKG